MRGKENERGEAMGEVLYNCVSGFGFWFSLGLGVEESSSFGETSCHPTTPKAANEK